MTLEIISNHHRRELLYWEQLTEKEQREFDWMDEQDRQDHHFFRYKGWVYSDADFMAMGTMFSPENPFGKPWQGYLNDSFFSGVLVYYPEADWSDQCIVVGRFFS